jgi:peptide methionine sulfoxide reductase MsrB
MKYPFRVPRINEKADEKIIEQRIKELGCSHAFQTTEKEGVFQCVKCNKEIIIPTEAKN